MPCGRHDTNGANCPVDQASIDSDKAGVDWDSVWRQIHVYVMRDRGCVSYGQRAASAGLGLLPWVDHSGCVRRRCPHNRSDV